MRLCVLLPLAAVAQTTQYITTPEKFGAKGDGKSDDWLPIIAAINDCDGHKQCTVLFSKR